jgi:agmatine deiminase
MTTKLSAAGFRLPAEWDEHESTWTCWPFDEEMWAGKLNEVRCEFTALVHAISNHEKVHILVRDQESRADCEKRMGSIKTAFPVELHMVPLDDVWFRDSGPLYVVRTVQGETQVLPTKWEFNSWGRKFFWENDNKAAKVCFEHAGVAPVYVPIVMEGGSLEQDGLGNVITTRQCLLSKERNPSLDSSQIEQTLNDYLGIQRVCWLDLGLEGDHTDGHVDTIVRFAGPQTVLCHTTKNSSDANYRTMLDNRFALETFSKHHRLGWKVLDLPLPSLHLERDGERLPLTYANYYLCNGGVVIPQYGAPEDESAVKVISACFPGRKVYALKALALILGGGSFHCVTQQQPKGRVVSADVVDLR